MEPDSAEIALRAQYERFLAELPRLLARCPGKWAVWFDGFRGAYETEDDAEQWAVQNLPRDAAFVIAPVEEPKPVLLSGMAAFGFGA